MLVGNRKARPQRRGAGRVQGYPAPDKGQRDPVADRLGRQGMQRGIEQGRVQAKAMGVRSVRLRQLDFDEKL